LGCAWRIKRRFANLFNVEKIPRSTRGKLVRDQVFSGDEVGRCVAFNQCVDMIFPCLVEADAVDLLENVDPVGWNSDLEAPFGASKVLWGEAFEGRAIFAKCPQHGVTRGETNFTSTVPRTERAARANNSVSGCIVGAKRLDCIRADSWLPKGEIWQ